MHYVLLALIIGAIFGLVSALVVYAAKKELSLVIAIIGGGAFLAGFFISWIDFWFALPNVGTIILVCLLLLGIGSLLLLRYFSSRYGRIGKSWINIMVIVIASGMIATPAYFGIHSAIFKGFNQAKYFDHIITYSENPLPFDDLISGNNLRVVDKGLASEIIQKSSPFGSNAEILELHIGKINGQLMWVASMGTDDIRIGTDNAGRKRNTVFGFIGVDLTDPTEDVVIIEQSFSIGYGLARTNKLERFVWKINPNYRPGVNAYYSMNDENEMRLIVPYYHVQSWRSEKKGSIGMTTYLQKVGGVLEFDSAGNLVKDYKDLTTLP
ncbi:MAG: hypothetical protein U9O98_11595 [Asgard group archaeon]|nr:hypothetical protein [Asgard group archaeon]